MKEKRGILGGEKNNMVKSQPKKGCKYQIIEYYPNVSIKLRIQMLTHKPHHFWLYEYSYIFDYIVKQITCAVCQDIDLRQAIINLDKIINK